MIGVCGTKRELYVTDCIKTVAVPVLLYNSESWVLSEKYTTSI